jgi:hypothetical protein
VPERTFPLLVQKAPSASFPSSFLAALLHVKFNLDSYRVSSGIGARGLVTLHRQGHLAQDACARIGCNGPGWIHNDGARGTINTELSFPLSGSSRMSKAHDASQAASFWCLSHFTYRALAQKLDIQVTGAASDDSLGIAVNVAARNRRSRRKRREKAVGLSPNRKKS